MQAPKTNQTNMKKNVTLTERQCRIIADALLEHQETLSNIKRRLDSYGINELSVEMRMKEIVDLLGKI